MTLEEIASANHGKKSGRGYLIRCPNPSHNDAEPSCHIDTGPDGKLLAHCFAGCDQTVVVGGLKSQGFWPESDPTYRPSREPESKTVEATYTYSDERGDLLYQIVRYFPKAFVQRYPDGHGGWI